MQGRWALNKGFGKGMAEVGFTSSKITSRCLDRGDTDFIDGIWVVLLPFGMFSEARFFFRLISFILFCTLDINVFLLLLAMFPFHIVKLVLFSFEVVFNSFNFISCVSSLLSLVELTFIDLNLALV